MNSRGSWSNEGIDPSVRERAEAAARQAGMSLNDWLNLTLGETASANFRLPYNPGAAMPVQESRQESRDVADIHQRLDSITRQIEQISQGQPRGDPAQHDAPVARQLNDAIARLDARLSQISNPPAPRQHQMQNRQPQADMVETAAAQTYRPSPPLSPISLNSAISEVTARQNELDATMSSQEPRNAAPLVPSAPAYTPPLAPAGPDFSSLERHLVKITSQIEALQRPDPLDQSISAFRGELAEIRHAITEAMPRQAIESIESEIRSLVRRIDDTRQSGIDSQALGGIERTLGEIREVLRSLTSAEQLAGYDEAIRNLTVKLDQILRANNDPSTVHQLEGAIAALRAIVSNVASNEALARLSDDVRALSAKVDQLARTDHHSESLATLEHRIAALTFSLESHQQRPATQESSEQIENALRALSDRLERMPVGNDNASAFAHLEQRVSHLLERLEASADQRPDNLGRVEAGLQDILHHLERQHAAMAALAANGRSEPAADDDGGLADIVKRELSDIRFNQAETNRHTQDSLEAVHSTLGHVVDRLAMIDGDLRTARTQPATPRAAAEPNYAETPTLPWDATAVQSEPELPNPAATPFAAASRDFLSASTAQPPAAPPKAISYILEPHTPPSQFTIEPDLPPDHPLEPGTRPSARASSPSERIAASENAISEIPTAPSEPVSTSSFIAAARRAAQAAAAAQALDKAKRPPKSPSAGQAQASSTIGSKIRSLLVGASVVIIVLGTFKMAMTLLDSGNPPVMDNSSEQQVRPADDDAAPVMPLQAPPSMISPTPIGRQSFNKSVPGNFDGGASAAIPQNNIALPGPPADEVTGAIPPQPTTPGYGKYAVIQVPPSERLPDTIGGPVLRDAVLKGDAAAAYEVGIRFAEGKGVTSNFDAAAKWLDRAARAGVVPAIFRLGTFYEKGLGVKKDADIARRYYMQAAERGNAKAMHNLAVLDADGGGKGANYKSASQWFRKAAEYGIADSQYNIAILYARGIGVEQNLAESFKWFSLAAAQGDPDGGQKRDAIAKHLDDQSLAAARLAIQTFTAEPQPDDAIKVAAPAGGWDLVSTQDGSVKPAVKPAASKHIAAMH